jgi:surface protein
LSNGTYYNFDVDWGDGVLESFQANNLSAITHTYATAGDYQVSIKGHFPRIYGSNDPSAMIKLRSIDQWGSVQRQTMNGAFYNAQHLAILATDTPNLISVTDMSSMFYGATNLTGNFSGWDTSKVYYFNYLFSNASNFNSPLTGRKLNRANNVQYMFQSTAFNQDLSSWDLSGANNLSRMFANATAFNGSLSGRNTSSVTNMDGIFYSASSFNQPVAHFNTSKVTSMQQVFHYAYTFNQPVHTWDTSKVQTMYYLFGSSQAFNQDLSSRNLSSVTNMSQMFYDNINTGDQRNIGAWDTHTVTNMSQMFANASHFNQPLS